ncbi:hypothetical protein [Carboxylicivirga marina]|uniref:Uncharacterized protein n=1 Tax=Carboxylicivirga marina TaxID=2800988 RepID=A0ABS1HH99_9BACT|nr:hypothetical protein [Carboxylicivirga marina]MBK3516658.1 hypothetical protein [Carboxylicivirga marina]
MKFSGSCLLATLTIFLVCTTGFSQDKLIKTSNDTINCVIKEIGDLEIKYSNPDVSETILFGIDKSDVAKVILANGKVLTFTKSISNPANYADNHKNIIKVNFLSPLFNSLKMSYERSIRPGRSFETTLGIIGVGNDIYEADEKGAFIKIGLKYIKSPDYYLRGQRYAHILKGTYIRPEIAFSYYSYDYHVDDMFYSSDKERKTNAMFGILLNFGKQWVIDNGFIVDTFV